MDRENRHCIDCFINHFATLSFLPVSLPPTIFSKSAIWWRFFCEIRSSCNRPNWYRLVLMYLVLMYTARTSTADEDSAYRVFIRMRGPRSGITSWWLRCNAECRTHGVVSRDVPWRHDMHEIKIAYAFGRIHSTPCGAMKWTGRSVL